VAWEKHDDRVYYYYKKQRIGKKVKSIYVGTGELANLISDIDHSIRRAQKTIRQSNKLKPPPNTKS
jgi:hypothetical protein